MRTNTYYNGRVFTIYEGGTSVNINGRDVVVFRDGDCPQLMRDLIMLLDSHGLRYLVDAMVAGVKDD